MSTGAQADVSIAAHLADVIDRVPGWSPLDRLLSLFEPAFVSAHLGGDLVEIGSWCGRSAVALGLAARTDRKHTSALHRPVPPQGGLDAKPGRKLLDDGELGR